MVNEAAEAKDVNLKDPMVENDSSEEIPAASVERAQVWRRRQWS
jgi:hypothetical protein